MKHLEDEDIDVFTRSLGVVASKETKERDQVIRVMSNSITSIHNAFEMVKTYSENMLAINKAVVNSNKRNTRENTVENFYEQPSQDALASNITNRFPQMTSKIEMLASKFAGLDLASKQSVLSSVSSGMKSILMGTAVAGAAGAAYLGSQFMSDDDEEGEEYDSPAPGKVVNKGDKQEYEPEPKAPSAPTSKFERLAEKQVSPEKKQNVVTSAFVAEQMRDMVKLPGGNEMDGYNIGSTSAAVEQFYGLVGGESGGHIPAAGSSANASKALGFFTSQGWSLEQAAGIVGNLQAESGPGLNPASFNSHGGGMGARGIAQWRGPRIRKFQELYGTTPEKASLDQQLQFVQWELNNTHSYVGRELKQINDPSKAAFLIYKKYEAPDDGSHPKRIAYAKALIQRGTQAASEGFTMATNFGSSVVRQSLDQVDDGTLRVPANLKQYIKLLDGSVNLKGMHPTVMKRFAAMAMEYNEQTGDKIQVNSAFRTRAEQEVLFKRLGRGKAAEPGKSRHESGLALDIQSVQANRLIKMGLMSKYKFHRPMSWEDWHIEPIESRAIPRASAVEEHTGSDTKASTATREASRNSRSGVAPLSERSTITKKKGNAEAQALLGSRGGGFLTPAPRPARSSSVPGGTRSTPTRSSSASVESLRAYFTR